MTAAISRTAVHDHVFGHVLFGMRGTKASERQRAQAAWNATCAAADLPDIGAARRDAVLDAMVTAGDLAEEHGGLRSDVDSVYASTAYGIALGYLEAIGSAVATTVLKN